VPWSQSKTKRDRSIVRYVIRDSVGFAIALIPNWYRPLGKIVVSEILLFGREYRQLYLADAQDRLYSAEIPESCGHARDQGSVAYSNSDDSYRVSPFAPSQDYKENGADTWIYALQGHKLEQMLQVSEPGRSTLLQLFVCMRCAIRIAKEKRSGLSSWEASGYICDHTTTWWSKTQVGPPLRIFYHSSRARPE